MKSSWDTSWGDHGYVKIARSESTNDPGICAIAMDPSLPVVYRHIAYFCINDLSSICSILCEGVHRLFPQRS